VDHNQRQKGTRSKEQGNKRDDQLIMEREGKGIRKKGKRKKDNLEEEVFRERKGSESSIVSFKERVSHLDIPNSPLAGKVVLDDVSDPIEHQSLVLFVFLKGSSEFSICHHLWK